MPPQEKIKVLSKATPLRARTVRFATIRALAQAEDVCFESARMARDPLG
jgi:hypothetical protein